MNLTITPISYNGYSNNNIQNNKKQNFEALPTKIKTKATIKTPNGEIVNTGLTKTRDILVEKFIKQFEKNAQKRGMNTTELGNKGYTLQFMPTHKNDGSMRVLLNKANETIRTTVIDPGHTTRGKAYRLAMKLKQVINP